MNKTNAWLIFFLYFFSINPYVTFRGDEIYSAAIKVN